MPDVHLDWRSAAQSGQYVGLQIEFARDGGFDQKMRMWSALILPSVIYSITDEDCSEASRKRRLQKESDSAEKRRRAQASPSSVVGGGAAGGAASIAPITPSLRLHTSEKARRYCHSIGNRVGAAR